MTVATLIEVTSGLTRAEHRFYRNEALTAPALPCNCTHILLDQETGESFIRNLDTPFPRSRCRPFNDQLRRVNPCLRNCRPLLTIRLVVEAPP